MSIIVPLLVAAAPFVTAPEPAPADGLRLDAVPPVVSPVRLPVAPVGDGGGAPLAPLGFGGAAMAGAAAVAVTTYTKRRQDPLVVLVHGDGGSVEDFAELVEGLGIASDRVVAFDYRDVTPGATSTEASRHTDAADAAAGLDNLLRDFAEENANIYTIHHSKGAAAGVELIASLDDGTRPMIDGYRGAALLDPAIDKGFVGFLQSHYDHVDFIPDNGNFNPIRCDDSGCRDIRDHLGEASGVEVIAIRNPDALVTNFTDRPEGLRTYDLVDDGGPPAWIYGNPFLVVRRMAEAHRSVLDHVSVTACVRDEIERPGSCTWTGDRFNPPAFGYPGSGSHDLHVM